jgi:hypothetical protein
MKKIQIFLLLYKVKIKREFLVKELLKKESGKVLEREDSFIHYIKCLIRKKNNLLMMI